MLGLLRQFPGYTLRSLLKEDAELLRLLRIEARGRIERPDPYAQGGGEWYG